MTSSPPLNSVGRQKMSEPNMSVLAGVSRWALKKPEAAAAAAGREAAAAAAIGRKQGLRPGQQ